MPTRPKRHNPRGNKRKPENRPGARQRGYDSRWERERRRFLTIHPLCIECKHSGRVEPATVVDHIRPHRGNNELFWDIDNWQPLCAACHNAKTGRGE